jgi:D-alanyl-D-alanine carboxypeptidase
LLLMHRAGMSDKAWLTDNWVRAAQRDASDVVGQRRDLVARVVREPPAHAVGVMEYCNLDYIVVGAAIEAMFSESWETIMRREVFVPLGIGSGGFGAARGRVPWAHRSIDGRPTPVDPRRNDSDNPAVIGPAGTAHMSLQDYATFVRVFLNDGAGILSSETIKTLITPFGTDAVDYALGWVVVRDRLWAKGIMLGHEGTNTLNHAYCAIAPAIGKAIIAFSNDGTRGAMATADVASSLAATLA